MLLQTALNPQFVEAASRLASEPLPIRTAFKLKKLIAQVNAEVQTYQEVRMEKLKQYSELDENGNIVALENGSAKMTPEGNLQFRAEMTDLAGTEIAIEPIPIDELGNISISAVDLTILEGLIA